MESRRHIYLGLGTRIVSFPDLQPPVERGAERHPPLQLDRGAA
jgi:hypothetical protein